MNSDHIRKLIRTKSTILFPGTDIIDCDITDIEEFTKFIINECLTVIQKEGTDECVAKDGVSLYYKVAEHFGVK